jgi:hypothetical protein
MQRFWMCYAVFLGLVFGAFTHSQAAPHYHCWWYHHKHHCHV